MLHPSGVARLERLGLLDKLLATGAPPLDQGSFVIDDVRLEMDGRIAKRFEAPWLCVRRVTLDSLLVEMAREAGAQVRTQTSMVGLVEEAGVVRGVRTETGTISAPLIVGADGRDLTGADTTAIVAAWVPETPPPSTTTRMRGPYPRPDA